MTPTTMTRLGWVLTGLYGLFTLGASVAPKLLGMPVADETMAALGWQDSPILLIGLIELACVVLYLIPKTAVLGAVLSMAVLGGAMVTQIRAGSPLFSHTLFSFYLGLVMWAGIWLRCPRLRKIFPLR
ncbi:MAG: DoxX family protein [Paracoccaceae bacterium]